MSPDLAPPMPDVPARARRSRTAPLLSALILLLTVVFSVLLAASVHQQQQARFDREVAVYTRALQERLTAYVDVLRAARALNYAAGSTSQDDFRRFVLSVDLGSRYPGIQRLGWARWVKRGEADGFVRERRAEGQANFTLQPPGARPAYTPVTYLEPQEGAQQVLGYDMYADAVRRPAIDRAIDSGTSAATPGVSLRAGGRGGAARRGFIMYLPVYRGGGTPATVEARRAALEGLMYAPIGMDDFLAGVYPASRLGALQVRVSDSGALLNTATPPTDFTRRTTLSVADRQWTLDFGAPSSFGQDRAIALPWLTALLGAAIALLVFRTTRALEDARTRAEDARTRLAASQAKLTRAQAEFEAVFRSMRDTAVFTDTAGRVRLVNDAVRRSFGLEPAQLLGEPLVALRPVVPEGEGGSSYAHYQRQDGTQFQAEVQRSEVRDEGGQLIGQLEVIRDVTERQEAERARHAADLRFRGLLEALPQFIWTADAQGRTTSYNQGWYDYTGQARGEALGDGWLSVLHPDDAEPTDAAWRRSWADQLPYEVEYRLRRHDGQYRWFVSRGTPIRDGRGEVIEWVGTCTDIQTRIEQDQQLRRSEARSRHLLASLPQIVWVLDAAGELTYVNDRWHERVPDAYRHDALGAVLPEDRAVLQQAWALARQDGSSFTVQYRLQQRDGRHRYYLSSGLPLLDERGEVREWIVTSTDVDNQVYAENTARLLAEFSRVLSARFGDGRDLEGALRLLAQPFASSVLLALPGATSFHFMLVTAQAEDERAQEAVLDQLTESVASLAASVMEHREALMVEDRPALEAVNLQGVLALPVLTRGGEAIAALVLSFRQRPDDRDLEFAREAAIRLGLALENEQLLEQAQGAQRQLTELNQTLEARVQERTQELQEANRELEAFSYSVSHDLRTPLRHVVGFADLLRKESDGALSGKSERYLTIISDAARRMSGLIDDLLNFSRMGRQPLRVQEVALGALVDEARAELTPDTEGREVTWKVGALPTVRGDPGLLKLVVLNLLTNALKYSRNNAHSVIEVDSRIQGGEVVVWVRDNGVGFDSRFGERLFGVFQRLHRQEEFEGTGIGLANVRRIVTRHGGRVWAESELGQGATFSFSLPLNAPALVSAGGEPGSQEQQA